MLKAYTKKYKCSFCKKNEVEYKYFDKEKITPEKGIIFNGAINWFTAGYGSKFDGKQFLLAICDECLKECIPISIKDCFFTK